MGDPLITIGPSVCFKVQKIIGVSIGEGNSRNYQVQWAPSWVSGFHLVGCDHLIEEFTLQQSGKAQFFDGNCYGVANNEQSSYSRGNSFVQGSSATPATSNLDQHAGEQTTEPLFDPLDDHSAELDPSTSVSPTTVTDNRSSAYPLGDSRTSQNCPGSLEDEIQITSYYSVSRTPTEGDDIKIVFVESHCNQNLSPTKKHTKQKSPSRTPSKKQTTGTQEICHNNESAQQITFADESSDNGNENAKKQSVVSTTTKEGTTLPSNIHDQNSASNENGVNENLVENILEAMEVILQSDESGTDDTHRKNKMKSTKSAIPSKKALPQENLCTNQSSSNKKENPPVNTILPGNNGNTLDRTVIPTQSFAHSVIAEPTSSERTSQNGHTTPYEISYTHDCGGSNDPSTYPQHKPLTSPVKTRRTQHAVPSAKNSKRGNKSLVIEMPEMDQSILRKYCPEPMELITLAPTATVEQPRYECDQCFRVFRLHSALARHVTRTHHPQSPVKDRVYKHTCGHCSKGFQRYTCFIKHMVKIHGVDPPMGEDPFKYQCSLCPRAFSKSSSLSRHLTATHLRTMNIPAVTPEQQPRMGSEIEPGGAAEEPCSSGLEHDASGNDSSDAISQKGEGKAALHRRLRLHRTYPSRHVSTRVHLPEDITSPVTANTAKVNDASLSIQKKIKGSPVESNSGNSHENRNFFDTLNEEVDDNDAHLNGVEDILQKKKSPTLKTWSEDADKNDKTVNKDVNKYILYNNKPKYSLDTDTHASDSKSSNIIPSCSGKGDKSKTNSPTLTNHCKSNGASSTPITATSSDPNNPEKTRRKTNNSSTSKQPKGKYRCHECGKVFPKSAALARHFNKTHGVVQGGIFECGICQLKFKTPAGIRKHMHIHMTPHQQTETLSCCFCDKVFGSSTKLQRHVQGHTAERPYHCPSCPKTFKRSDHMTRHLQSHVKSSPTTTSEPVPLPPSSLPVPLPPPPAPNHTPGKPSSSRSRKSSSRVGGSASKRAEKSSSGMRMKPSRRRKKSAVKISVKSEPTSTETLAELDEVQKKSVSAPNHVETDEACTSKMSARR